VYDDGPALLAGVREQGLPGVMARRRDTPYDADAPADWLRVVAPAEAPTAPTAATAVDLPTAEQPPAGPALSALAPTDHRPDPSSGKVPRGRHSRGREDPPGLW
jgi:hypothetical protein